MIRIAGLRALSDRLARMDMAGSQKAALEDAARGVQSAVQESLSNPPGSDHMTPWRRTGALLSSIDFRSDDTGAAIGSDDPVAIDQELGTSRIPPRPFLYPVASENGEIVAKQVAGSIAAVIRNATNGSTP
jgi:phage gpG-like protein